MYSGAWSLNSSYPPASGRIDGAITKFAAEFPKTEPSFLDPGKSGILAFPGDVGPEFAGAPEQASRHSSRLRHSGTHRPPGQGHDDEGMPAFANAGLEEPDKPAADHGQVGFGMKLRAVRGCAPSVGQGK